MTTPSLPQAPTRVEADWLSSPDRLSLPWYRLLQALLLVITVAACWVSLRLHGLRFSGYDVSPMIDGGWRVFSGQRAGRDFIGTFPASLNLMVAWSYQLFGVSWHAIGLMASLLSGLLCLLGLRLASLLRSAIGNTRAIALAGVYVTTQLTILIYINYLWHASMVQALGLYAVLAVAVLLLRERQRVVRAECFVHLAVVLPFLVLSKPNTAYPLLLLCFGVLWFGKVPRIFCVALAAAVLGGSSLLLYAAHMNPATMLLAYRGLAGRLIPKPLIVGLLYHVNFWGIINVVAYVALAPLLLMLSRHLRGTRSELRRSAIFALAAGCIGVALLGFCTNYDYKMTDTPLLLLGATLLAVTGRRDDRLLRWTLLVTAMLAVVGLFFGVTRVRMQVMGQWAAESCVPRIPLAGDVFFGHLTSCYTLSATLAEVDRVLAETPHTNVFFGSTLEFLYARNRLPSPLHLPVWWDPGISYPLASERNVVSSWEQDRFDLLIFPHGVRAPIPKAILDLIASQYQPLPGTTFLDVYTRRPAIGETAPR